MKSLGIRENCPQFSLLVLINACVGGMVGLGLGTAMVYPALLASVGDISSPSTRATSLGWYRFWRDLGYPAGALLAGIVSGLFGLISAVFVAAALTLIAGLVAAWFMETSPLRGGHRD